MKKKHLTEEAVNLQEVKEILQNAPECLVVEDEAVTYERAEEVYSQAFLLYNNGKYLDASKLFKLLIILKPTEAKYLFGSAACLHMLKYYDAAAKMYTLCSSLDPQNPLPLYHASDCLIQMRDRPGAILYLQMAIDRSAAQPQFQVLKDRAILTIASLKKELQHGWEK